MKYHCSFMLSSLCALANLPPCALHAEVLDAMVVKGPEEIVYSAQGNQCSDVDKYGRTDVLDASVRPVRLINGDVIVFAAHYSNYVFRSRGFPEKIIRDDCRSVLKSNFDPVPTNYADHEWLIAPYTFNGVDIYGVVHNEYWGGLYNDKCKERLGGKNPWDSICLYGSLRSAFSDNGGSSFRRMGDIAFYQYKFTESMNRAGVRDPSNIFYDRDSDSINFFAIVDGYGEQKYGTCLFRSFDKKFSDWKTLDESGNWVSFSSPSNQKVAATCRPIVQTFISNVVYSQEKNKYLAVGYDSLVGGIYYIISSDLLSWSSPKLLLKGKSFRNWKKGDEGPVLYPSLIDPASTSLNFDVVGNEFYLYFLRSRVDEKGFDGRTRDIIRVPLTFN